MRLTPPLLSSRPTRADPASSLCSGVMTPPGGLEPGRIGEGEEGREEAEDEGTEGPAAWEEVFRWGERVFVCIGSIELM